MKNSLQVTGEHRDRSNTDMMQFRFPENEWLGFLSKCSSLSHAEIHDYTRSKRDGRRTDEKAEVGKENIGKPGLLVAIQLRELWRRK